ncbi:MAG: bis(5'-nucleosyl)-tetraphosphatase (symmetrical) YqeK [Syntrophomonadaceae bacterium]
MISQAEALQLIRGRLCDSRWRHSLGVAMTAQEMARQHGGNPDQAYLAGILHDYARDLSGSELLALARCHNLIQDEIEILVPELLHARVGAWLLRRELGLDDEDLLTAVECHTLGAEKMNELAKIIFLADMIEPGRRPYPALENLRRLCPADLDKAMLVGLESTISYCLERGRLLHPLTVRSRNAFLLACQARTTSTNIQGMV